MLKEVKADLYRIIPKSYSVLNLLRGFRNQGFRFLFFKRIKNNYSFLHPYGLLARFAVRRYMYKYGFQIGGRIGEGLLIGHFGIIVVSVNAIIGSNCNIAHNVTIGAARGNRAGAPKIGDNVWIGCGAVLVGNITIGTDVLIAPNCYVNFDVPNNSIVLGNPGKIIAKPNPTKDYINNQWISREN